MRQLAQDAPLSLITEGRADAGLRPTGLIDRRRGERSFVGPGFSADTRAQDEDRSVVMSSQMPADIARIADHPRS